MILHISFIYNFIILQFGFLWPIFNTKLKEIFIEKLDYIGSFKISLADFYTNVETI